MDSFRRRQDTGRGEGEARTPEVALSSPLLRASGLAQNALGRCLTQVARRTAPGSGAQLRAGIVSSAVGSGTPIVGLKYAGRERTPVGRQGAVVREYNQ